LHGDSRRASADFFERIFMARLFRQVRQVLMCCLGIFSIAQTQVIAADWTVSVDEHSGLPTVTRGGASAVSSSWVFWGANWAWSDLQTGFKVVSPGHYLLEGRNNALGFDFSTGIQQAGERQLVWDFQLNGHDGKSGVVGGGMVFKFDLASFGAEMGEPTILPNDRGWAWGRDAARRIELRFDPGVADVFFERGNKSELRAFFYRNTVTAGTQRITATLTIGNGIALGPTTSERFGLANPADWPRDNIDWKTAPVNLAFLNEKPAGKRGFVKTQGDALVFGDGTPARFWGTNVTAYALFNTPKDAACQQAKRLAALGFNLVRIHHHDSPWVNPNIFGDGKFAKDTQRIDASMQDKIDNWIGCLKNEGIYVWLDLHVQRAFKPGDGIYGFDEISKGQNQADLKGYNYVNLTIQQAMKRFAEAYVTHVNPYTGLAYKDEPAIMAMLITNENDITHHFGNKLLPDKGVPDHNKIYMSEASAFAERQGLPTD
jgi:hypothetical protein